METVVLGPFVLNFHLFILFVSAVTGLFILKYCWKKSGAEQQYSEKFTTALILGIIVWKVSLILFDPIGVIQNPLSLLYFSGGNRGIVLGLAAASAYLMYKMKKDQTPFWLNVDVLFTGWIAGNTAFYGLTLVTSHFYIWQTLLTFVFYMIILFLLLRRKHSIGSFHMLQPYVIWYCVGMITIPFFTSDRETMWIGLTSSQIIFVIIFIMTFILEAKLHDKKKGDS